MDAIVTAGGRIQGEFAAETGVTIKALLTLGGKTLLRRAVEVLRESGCVSRVCVVGPPEVDAPSRHAGADLFVLERQTGIDNLMLGLDALAAQGHVLCCASDLPLLRPADVADLVARTPDDARLTYAVFTREEWEGAFAGGSHATYVPLADGEFTGACVHVQDAGTLRAIEPLAQRAFAARKSQVAMARLLGPGLVARLLAGHVLGRRVAPSTAHVCRRIETLVGHPCAMVRGAHPRAGADADTLDDWRWVCGIAANEAARPG